MTNFLESQQAKAREASSVAIQLGVAYLKTEELDTVTAQTITDLLDVLEEEMGERLTERNLAKVSDEYIFETEGECIAYNTLHRKLTEKINQLRE